jgi:hypothetical protein
VVPGKEMTSDGECDIKFWFLAGGRGGDGADVSGRRWGARCRSISPRGEGGTGGRGTRRWRPTGWATTAVRGRRRQRRQSFEVLRFRA